MIKEDIKEIIALLKKQEEERVARVADKRAETEFNLIFAIVSIIILGIIAVGC